jgi:hypothetical protein
MIIGLTGPEGAGKSTAAKLLADMYGLEVLPFARPLKDMLQALGVPRRHLWGSPIEKAEPLAILNGKSAREAMQTLGTEWGRVHIGEGFWGDAWEARARAAGGVVADDCRFANEVERVRRMGGLVVCIVRDMADFRRVPKHPSEDFASLDRDRLVLNAGTTDELQQNLLRAVDWGHRRRGIPTAAE